MFENIGGKIKTLAQVTALIGIVSSVIAGIVLMYTTLFLIGLAVLLFGSILFWISSFVLYGFGELIEKTNKIAENTLPKNVPVKGAWLCECGNLNDNSLEYCTVCKKTKTNKANVSVECSSKISLADEKAIKPGWLCECGFRNNDYATICENCFKLKPKNEK